MNEEQKRKAMNAISHRETKTQLRSFRGAKPEPSMLKGAVSNVKTVVKEVGLGPVALGAAVYAAKIREADREMRMQRIQTGPRVIARESGKDRLER